MPKNIIVFIGITFMEHDFLNYVYFGVSLCKLLGLNFRRVSTRKWKVVRVKMTNVDAKLNKFTPKKRTKDIEKDFYPHIKIVFILLFYFAISSSIDLFELKCF